MALPNPDNFQGGDAVLCAQMVDAGSDGYAGDTDGQVKFVAPFACRPKRVTISAENGFDVDTLIRVENSAGDSTLDQPPVSSSLGTGQGATLDVNYVDPPELSFAKGDMITVSSNGASTAGRPAYVYLTVSRDGPSDIPTTLFIITNNVEDGSVLHSQYYPVPFNVEILEVHGGTGALSTTAWEPRLFGHTNGQIGSAVVAAGPRDSTAMSSLRENANNLRFYAQGQYLQVVANPSVGGAGLKTYSVLCRRV